MVKEKYILETFANQLKDFIFNEDVHELLSNYCKVMSELFENEQSNISLNLHKLFLYYLD